MGLADSLRSARQPTLSGDSRRGLIDLCGGSCGTPTVVVHIEADAPIGHRDDLPKAAADRLLASFCEAVPKLRVLPTEAELSAFWVECDRMDQAQLCVAIRQQLTRSAEGPWQLQARVLRVLISAFGRQPRGRALASSALAGSSEGLVRQLASAEVPEVRDEAARVVQLLELSRSLPAGESLQDVARKGGLLSFTATAPAAPAPSAVAEPPRRSRKEFEASVDLLDLSPMPTLEPAAAPGPAASQVPAARRPRESSASAGASPTGSDGAISQLKDLIFAPAPERYHLGDPDAECGNQELEQMYSFVLRPKTAIPYVPPREAKAVSKPNDPFEFVSDHVREMTVT
ncbi:unnamed protein product [Symbiodinium natans]|uniref:Uncharacterized protein n=1 Tax=Symbiodinium natans TaxID=878477 RepID=A0A812HTY6_9DINO|nr:unnamed protein product [Symbiodinium natans]